MNILQSIVQKLETFAAAVVAAARNNGVDFAGKVAADASDSLSNLVEQVGEAATKFVTDLFSDDSLSGLEKANLATTQLVEHAATNGIEMAAHDATTIIKSAYLAVKSELSKL